MNPLKYQNLIPILFIISTITMIIFNQTDSFERGQFNPLNHNLKMKNETISMNQIWVFFFIIPIFLQILISIYCKISMKSIYFIGISFITANSTATSISEILKVIIGERRPDFNDRCKLINGVCTGNLNIIREGKRSFPSGHTLTAYCGCFFMFYFFHNFVVKKKFSGGKVKLFGIVGLIFSILLSSFVGFTRVNDNRHFLHDVIAGAIIGLTISSSYFYFANKAVKKEEENKIRN